jgi:hypothetical protein
MVQDFLGHEIKVSDTVCCPWKRCRLRWPPAWDEDSPQSFYLWRVKPSKRFSAEFVRQSPLLIVSSREEEKPGIIRVTDCRLMHLQMRRTSDFMS